MAVKHRAEYTYMPRPKNLLPRLMRNLVPPHRPHGRQDRESQLQNRPWPLQRGHVWRGKIQQSAEYTNSTRSSSRATGSVMSTSPPAGSAPPYPPAA